MYDTYAQRIYEWLRETFFPYYQEQIGDILSGLSDIVVLLRNGLYLGVFALLLWVAYTWLRPHLMKV
jgi:hypothetical protein|nr:MAG TPA: hypothetical protein [Inoviridae sp.]